MAKEEAKRFDDISTMWTRALQCYLVLLGMAYNRQCVQYGPMCQTYMKWGKARGLPLHKPLGAIWAWCEERGLPKLNELVVNSFTGLPGLLDYGDGPQALEAMKERERIFAVNWFTIVPPTAQELEDAYRAKFEKQAAA